ncbi:hypothetical protein [Streptomyces virginiae]|uniref:hypothetical protein n=1 Tax=Streptomyces virginiae TaxID=1961 RepID=UPI00379A342A
MAITVVIVTTFGLDEYVHTALHGGASGFALKDAGPAVLVEAVRAAAVGDSFVSPALTVRLLRRPAPHTTGGRPSPRSSLAGVRAAVRLSPRSSLAGD